MSATKSTGRKKDLPHKVEMVKVEHLFVDHSYQRALDERAARRIQRNFNEKLFGNLVVSVRSKTQLAVLDGQTRLKAALEKGYTEVPCEKLHCASVQEEARIFRLLNTERKIVNSFALWKAQVTEKDPAALGLLRVLNARGCEIYDHYLHGAKPYFPVFACVDALQRLYKSRGAPLLDEALFVIIEAYDPDYPNRANQTAFIQGLTHFIFAAQREDRYDRDHMVAVLKRNLPETFYQKSSSPSLYSHGRVRRMIAAIGEAYNKTSVGLGSKVRMKDLTDTELLGRATPAARNGKPKQ